MLKKRNLYIQLDGGIGNQFFQIAAGEFYSKKINIKAIYKTPLSNYINKKEDEFISLLSKSCPVYKNNILKYKLFRFIWRIDRKLIKIYPLYSSIRKVSDFKNFTDIRKIIINPSVREIRGYFQNSIYAQDSRKLIQDIIRETKISLRAQELIEKQKGDKPVGVHIRRGDYLKFEDLYGLLAIDYYEEIFEEILTNTPNQKFWIFSNDLENVKNLFSQSKYLPHLYFVDLKKELTDLESFILLSKCAGHITGNSTYSWWAAFIADNSKFVYCPDPWNKNIFYSDKLIPFNWIKQKSIWVNSF